MEIYEEAVMVLTEAIPLLRTYEQCFEWIERCDAFLRLSVQFRENVMSGQSKDRLRLVVLRMRLMRVSVYMKMLERAEEDERELRYSSTR